MKIYIANTKEEVKEMFPDADLILEGYKEDSDWSKKPEITHFYVYKNNCLVAIVRKPRKKEDVKSILLEGNFPIAFIEEIFAPKKTSVLGKILQAPENKGLVASGKAGIGKTYSVIFKIAKLIKYFKINRPLYITFQDVNAFNMLYKERELAKYDAIFMDDLNRNLNKLEKKLAETIIFHIYNRKKEKKLYITTNQTIDGLFSFINEEPIKSRVLEICTLLELKENKDLRVVTA